MSIRLAVYQRDDRPLDGLCAQLQCAGYDVFERYTEDAILDVIDRLDVDAVLLDADAGKSASVLQAIRDDAHSCRLPVMLIVEEPSDALGDLTAGVDDVIVLPILRDDLRSRVRNVARLASMTAELERRRETLVDFGIKTQLNLPVSSIERIQILLVGPMGDHQVAMIDMLDDSATFTYAATVDHAWHQLRQSYVDLIAVTGKMAIEETRSLYRKIRTTMGLIDLPVLLFESDGNVKLVEALGRDENVDLMRTPSQPVVTRKRLEVLIRQHRLKHQLRGIMNVGEYLPTVDNLTGLYARGFLCHHLDCCIQESRERGEPLSVATCTIRGLDSVNNILGYPAGDRLISQIGRVLSCGCRAQDLVARAGGASFCLVLNDTSEFEARTVCKRIAGLLDDAVDQGGGNRIAHVSLNFGIAELAGNDSAVTLIDRALHQTHSATLRQAS